MTDKDREAWQRHRDEQAKWWREHTTPEQRMLWLEEMIWVFRDYLPKKMPLSANDDWSEMGGD